MAIRVTVYGENSHEKQENHPISGIYPNGMHEAIADGIREQLGDAVTVRTVVLQDPEHGLTDEVLANTDVLTWWGHMAHGEVEDAVVDRIHARVLGGMGILCLHSAHYSKIFRKLMGTSCSLCWRDGDSEAVWNVAPGHPITEGVPMVFQIPEHEMYGEFFDIPPPDELIFISNFSGGEIFRSGCTWRRGYGKVFYFSPGHESNPIYHQPEIKRIIANSVKWLAPTMPSTPYAPGAPYAKPGWWKNGGHEPVAAE